ncbi:hypothetical protein [Pseudomonas tohonis]|uniref:hypothetical protein n=1 Tax=Pseudomonas TaxID=286 RepID=UPI000397BBAA|nr:hypothetical protein [Pseudomonas tohonis]EQM70971.1 hypothetical protein L682_07390 [Pseudomonas alcaligenes OT 69]MDN4146639.1 hypothetical protein [Pseudomonas tohonis]
MQITIDTPYVTVQEFARRSGLSDRSIRREIEQGRYLIRPKCEGSKSSVLINMVHMAFEAAEQAERVRADHSKSSSGKQ